MPLPLQSNWSHQALDLGCLKPWLLPFLSRQWASDDVLTDIVFLGEVVQLANLSDPLWSKATRHGGISQARYLLFSLLDNDKVEHTERAIDDAAMDRLAPSLPGATRPITGLACTKEELDSPIGEHTLLHRKPLLVIAASNTENISLERD